MSYAQVAGQRHAEPVRRSGGRARSAAMLVLLVAIGMLTAAVTFTAALGAALEWWPTTPRVEWAPPVLLVATIRSVVYIATAVAEWVVWTRRHRRPVRLALALFVSQQVLATVWPVVFFAGFGWLGIADLWITVAILFVLDLLLVATAAAFWSISRAASVVMMLDLVLVVFVTALILGSAGQHAVV